MLLVVGLGHEMRGDDGVGAAVVRQASGALPPDVQTLTLGGDPASLLDAWSGADAVVVVDAVRSGRPPGTIVVRDLAATSEEASPSVSNHGFGLAETVRLGRALGQFPASAVLVGVEAAGFGLGAPLSDAVRHAIPAAVSIVCDLAARFRATSDLTPQ